MKTILPLFYFPPISWFKEFLNADNEVVLEQFENFPKQTYRNRTNIYAANGKLSLIIPIQHKGKQLYKDVKISYAEDWQKQHWKSLTSAYQASPYFEYYELKLAKIFKEQPLTLFDLNLNCLKVVLDILKTEKEFNLSTEYEVLPKDDDFRSRFSAKQETDGRFPEYYQTFSDKDGFLKDLSVLDLICNLGPESRAYINNL
ncbi:WbqC family protein [Soonwooa sp.]|uniref:WbqC family protein n=1 Tax=Soonwooa sp. TaxID=1938592 RepID=UPI00260460FB|nr:WbqC family protein [Soonwooa sp.]